jgi:rhamnosyltransferase subunit B
MFPCKIFESFSTNLVEFYEDLQVGGVLSKKLEQFLLEGEDPLIFTLGSTTVVIPGSFYQESIQAAE